MRFCCLCLSGFIREYSRHLRRSEKEVIHNYFTEVNNELYNDNDEATVSLDKYNKLLNIYENEEEKNRLIESKYLKLVTEFADFASRQNLQEKEDKTLEKSQKSEQNPLFASSKKISDSFQNEIEKIQDFGGEKIGNEGKFIAKNEGKNEDFLNKKEEGNDKKHIKEFQNKTQLQIKSKNLDYLGMLNKGNEGDFEDEEDEVQVNIGVKSNSNVYNTLRVQELMEENKNLEENENLLMTQLSAVKEELRETRNKLKQTENSKNNSYLDINLLTTIRNLVEKLISEIKLSTKIKEILKVLLGLIGYSEEQILEIFKLKDKKKNIIGLYSFVE